MSSETSTESDALQPWQLFTLAGLIGATIVVFLSTGHTPAGIILLSLTIFGAAAVGLAAWRTFAPLSGNQGHVSVSFLGGRTRAALEREKALVLRSLKELEFDRAMGKVSEKDSSEMSARLRSRAARILGQLDAGTGYRSAIESEMARRIGSSAPDTAPPVVACRHCGARSDADARFCKRCGSSLETTE
ncbi:MAG: zinc ribbon domain-containing protein [Vicinamibacterales bacterium]